MAVDFDSYLPFDGTDVFEDGWRDFFGSALRDFVCLTSGANLKVAADSGRNVAVPAGKLLIDGEFGEITTTKVLPVTTNTSGNPRIDRVVARLDYNNHKIVLDVKAGTPGGSPNPPTLTQNTTIHEVSLAQIGPLASGYSNITGGFIVDERCLISPYALPLYASETARDLWLPFPNTGSVAATLSPNGQVFVYDSVLGWDGTRRDRQSLEFTPSGDEFTTSPGSTWPTGLTTSVLVPNWATSAWMHAVVPQVYANTATPNTLVDVRLGTVVGHAQRFRCPVDLRPYDVILHGAANVSALRGTTQTLRTVASNGTTGRLVANNESSAFIGVEFA